MACIARVNNSQLISFAYFFTEKGDAEQNQKLSLGYALGLSTYWHWDKEIPNVCSFESDKAR